MLPNLFFNFLLKTNIQYDSIVDEGQLKYN